MSPALDRFERFLVEASDRLYAASSRDAAPKRRWRRGRGPRRFSRRGLLIAIASSIVVAGGAAAAATLLDPGQRLADGTVRCYAGTSPCSHLIGGAPANGQGPTVLCRRWYRLNAHTGINPATLGFVACRADPTTVAVYVADRSSMRQCQRLGQRPLPAGFAHDLARLRTLEQNLTRLQRRDDCPSPTALAGQVRQALISLRLDDWKIVLPDAHATPAQLNSPAGTGGGRCGSLIAAPADNSPQSTVSVQQNQAAVDIEAALPRSTEASIYHAQARLYGLTYNTCFTVTSIRRLVRRTVARIGMQPRFVTTMRQNALGFMPSSQKLYNRGCVRFNSAWSLHRHLAGGASRPQVAGPAAIPSRNQLCPIAPIVVASQTTGYCLGGSAEPPPA